jgi:preprotein translocase subunit SecF
VKLREAVALFRGQRDFHLDIIGRRRWWFLFSASLLLLSVAGLYFRGLNLGIDFEGGALVEYENRSGVNVADVRETMVRFGRGDAVVQIVEGREVSIRTESLGTQRAEILAALAEQAEITPADLSVQDIGPRWGAQISRKALQGLIIFLVVVSIYVAFRFEWKMAVAGLVAMFHDLIITSGIYALVGREVTPETVIAILTILGYSLYDTVVIFDKIKENAESLSLVSKETYSGTVNLSLNQVMMRSVNTSLVTLLPIGTLLLFGGDTLKNFAFALFVGLALGAYSSIFVAAPVVAVLKEREPRMAQLRTRAAQRERPPRPALRAVPAAETGDGEAELEAVATRGRATAGSGARRQPAPRRKGKKRPRSGKRKR